MIEKNSLPLFKKKTKYILNLKSTLNLFQNTQPIKLLCNCFSTANEININEATKKKIILSNLLKYNSNPNLKNTFLINDLLILKNSHYNTQYKDLLILDNNKENLKKYYKYKDSLKKFPKFYQYYKNYIKFFIKPIFIDYFFREIMKKNYEKKAEFAYAQLTEKNNVIMKNKNQKIPKQRLNKMIFTKSKRIEIDNNIKENSSLIFSYNSLSNGRNNKNFDENNNLYEDSFSLLSLVDLINQKNNKKNLSNRKSKVIKTNDQNNNKMSTIGSIISNSSRNSINSHKILNYKNNNYNFSSKQQTTNTTNNTKYNNYLKNSSSYKSFKENSKNNDKKYSNNDNQYNYFRYVSTSLLNNSNKKINNNNIKQESPIKKSNDHFQITVFPANETNCIYRNSRNCSALSKNLRHKQVLFSSLNIKYSKYDFNNNGNIKDNYLLNNINNLKKFGNSNATLLKIDNKETTMSSYNNSRKYNVASTQIIRVNSKGKKSNANSRMNSCENLKNFNKFSCTYFRAKAVINGKEMYKNDEHEKYDKYDKYDKYCVKRNNKSKNKIEPNVNYCYRFKK